MSEWTEQEARRREKLHREAGDYRQNLAGTDGFETNNMGLIGEERFSVLSGLPVRCLYRPGGDDGWDFRPTLIMDRIPLVYDLDCKTAQKPTWLICEVDKTRPTTIYVLFRYLDGNAIEQGWQWGSEMMSRKPRWVFCPKTGRSNLCHWWPNDDSPTGLRKMHELLGKQVK